MTIKGLVFDFDGLIMDTEIPEYQAWLDIYREYGVEFPNEKWALVLGANYDYFDPVDHLQDCAGLHIDKQEMIARHDAIANEMGLTLPVLPGIREAIEEATRLRLKLAVASSSSRAWVTGKLNQVGLVPYFDCIYTSDDVSRIKPDPELFRAAVNGLGIQPHEALAFEDSPNGVTSAKAAGLFCVAIPNTITSTLSLDHADLILPSLAERPLGELLNYFNNNHHS